MDDIKKIAVLGVSLKGTGIAQIALMAGFKITFFDFKKHNLEKGLLEIERRAKDG